MKLKKRIVKKNNEKPIKNTFFCNFCRLPAEFKSADNSRETPRWHVFFFICGGIPTYEQSLEYFGKQRFLINSTSFIHDFDTLRCVGDL